MDGLTQQRVRPAALVRADGWAVTWRPSPQAALRLFCLPHTGGGAAVYRDWADQLAPDIEVVAIRLPGRECRFREPAFARADQLVAEMIDCIAPLLDRPHAWFGHSMGALLAFESCRMLHKRRLPTATRLLVAGRRAPHLAAWEPPVHAAPQEELVERLRMLNGTPPEVLDDPAVIRTLLPTLRADFAISERYAYAPERPLDCPITALGGTRDPMATFAELAAWGRHTAAGCTVHMIDGDHFFLHTSQRSVIPLIRDALLLNAPHGRLR